MADNYLEKKYEALQHGKVVYRRNAPSLDTLLRTVAADTQAAASYTVKMAQLEAAARSATLLDAGFSCECIERPDGIGEILVSASASRIDDGTALGAFLLAMRLKAAELGLRSRIVLPDADQISPVLAKVEVLK